MTNVETPVRPQGGRMHIARSRGAASGFLLIVLGAIGALIPFVGPYFDFAWGTDAVWVWTVPRGWLEVLPGVVAAVGGFLTLTSSNRATVQLGTWLAIVAGAWFVVGRNFREVLGVGDVGRPLATTEGKFAALDLVYFSGLGVLIVFLGALALGRLSVRSVRDVDYAQRTATDRHADAVDGSPQADHEPVTGSTPAQPVSTAEARPRRSLRNPLGRRRQDSTPASR